MSHWAPLPFYGAKARPFVVAGICNQIAGGNHASRLGELMRDHLPDSPEVQSTCVDAQIAFEFAGRDFDRARWARTAYGESEQG